MKSREDTPRGAGPWPAILPVALAFLFHFPVLFNELVWDDRSLILNNPRWDGPQSPLELFFRDYGLDLGAQARGYYRPLFTLLTWALYQVAGPSPFIYHMASLLVFCLGIHFVRLLFLRLFPEGTAWTASLAASLCAVHPLHTEISVIYASLPDWMCQIAAILTLIMIVRLDSKEKAPFSCIVPLAGVSFAAGLIKETAFLALGGLAVGCLAVGLLGERRKMFVYLSASASLLVGLALSILMRGIAEIHGHGIGEFAAPFTGNGAPRTLRACGTALRLFILPSETVFMRDLETESGGVWPALFFMCVMSGAGCFVWLVKSGGIVSALMLAWLTAGLFNISLAAASGLPFSERYLSVVPAVYFLFMGLLHFKLQARMAGILMAALLAYCGTQTLLGTLKCANSLSFFASLHDERPNEIYGMTGLADAFFWDKGDFENARRLAETAIALKPDDPTVRTMGQLLARIAILENRPADALPLLDWAQQQQSDYPIIENLRADALARLGKLAEAVSANERAIRLDSGNPAYHLQRARLLMDNPEFSEDDIWKSLETARDLGATLPDDIDTRDKIRAARKLSAPQTPR